MGTGQHWEGTEPDASPKRRSCLEMRAGECWPRTLGVDSWDREGDTVSLRKFSRFRAPAWICSNHLGLKSQCSNRLSLLPHTRDPFIFLNSNILHSDLFLTYNSSLGRITWPHHRPVSEGRNDCLHFRDKKSLRLGEMKWLVQVTWQLSGNSC